MESFSKILIDFPLYPQFWHLTWIHPDLLMDGRDTRGQKSTLKIKPTLAAVRHRCSRRRSEAKTVSV